MNTPRLAEAVADALGLFCEAALSDKDTTVLLTLARGIERQAKMLVRHLEMRVKSKQEVDK